MLPQLAPAASSTPDKVEGGGGGFYEGEEIFDVDFNDKGDMVKNGTALDGPKHDPRVSDGSFCCSRTATVGGDEFDETVRLVDD